MNKKRTKLRLTFDLISYCPESPNEMSKNVQDFLDKMKFVGDNLGYDVVKGTAKCFRRFKIPIKEASR